MGVMSEAIRQERRVLELGWKQEELEESIQALEKRHKEIMSKIVDKTKELNALIYGIEKFKNPDKFKALDLSYPELVLNVVSEVFKVSVIDILSKRRLQSIIMARNCAAALIYSHLHDARYKISLSELGRFLGGKDHASMIHSIKRFHMDSETNDIYRQKVEMVKEVVLKNIEKKAKKS